MWHKALFVSAMLLATTAQAEPVPYTQAPSVSFRTLPPVTDPKPLNASVRYVGGYELTARGTAMLTGLSDIQVFPDADGLKAEAVSDWGAVASFALRPDGKGGFADSALTIDLLRGETDQPFYDKGYGDSEDIAIDPATGTRYASFEGYQRVLRYASQPNPWKGRGQTLPLQGLPLFPGNEGMEGLTYIQEKAANGRTNDSLLIGVESGGFWRCGLTDYACERVVGPAVPGFLYKLTSLAVVDTADAARNHDILALYRYYDPLTGPRNILRLLRLDGNRLTVIEDLLKIAPPLPYDNYEGVSAVRTPAGYRLFLVCDGLGDKDKPKILIYDWTRQ